MDLTAWIITAYCLFGTTATGVTTYDGICAVDPKVIPLHSKVYIEGLGVFVAEDTGRLIKGKHIDIWIRDCKKAMNFGVQRRKIKIIKTVRSK